MLEGTRMVRAATLAVSMLGSLALIAPPAKAREASAQDQSLVSANDSSVYLSEIAPTLAPGAPGSLNSNRAPLMSLFDKAGLARPLDAARINVFGHIEGSYTYNFDNPARGLNLGRVFDFNDARFQINQLDLNIERQVDPTKFDIGGRLEMLYGTDSRFIHSSDFIDYGNKNQSSSSSSSSGSLVNGPEYQFDIPQLTLNLNIPIGNGLHVQVGKFLFFKQIDPNASVFYSHSFTFGGALPFTLTGATASYPITPDLTVEGGFSRGWGQTLTDNNGAIDALGRVNYKISKDTTFTLALITGPERYHDNGHYRTVFDGSITYSVNDRLTLLFDGVYGYQAEPSGFGNDSDQWYGLASYAIYKLCDYANLNLRGEFYRDEEGFTTGIKQTLFEVTLGMTLTPFPDSTFGQNLKIRPEIRDDYSTRAYFNGLRDHNQFTFAVDAYYDF